VLDLAILNQFFAGNILSINNSTHCLQRGVVFIVARAAYVSGIVLTTGNGFSHAQNAKDTPSPRATFRLAGESIILLILG